MASKICIAGNFDIAINGAKFILNRHKDCELFSVINKSDRGINSWQPSYKKFCNQEGIKILSLNDCYPKKNLIFISLHYDKIIETKKFKSKKLFNLHFSLLPAYKGMHTSAFPLLNGERYSGVTIHKIDDGIDTGDIISQKKFKIHINDNARDLFLKYMFNGNKLFKNTIDSLINNTYKSYPQSIIESSYFNKASINFSNISINLNKTAYEVHNQIRAFSFKEYQLPIVMNYKIVKSKITSKKSILKPGKIVFNKPKSIQIATADYDIILFKKN